MKKTPDQDYPSISADPPPAWAEWNAARDALSR